MNIKHNQLTITMADGSKVEICLNNSCETIDTTEVNKETSKLYLNQEKGRKLNMIRIILVLWDMGYFVDEHGRKAKKKDAYENFGSLLNTDFTHFIQHGEAILLKGIVAYLPAVKIGSQGALQHQMGTGRHDQRYLVYIIIFQVHCVARHKFTLLGINL